MIENCLKSGKSMKNKKMIGNLMLILTAMIWGSAFVAQRVGMDDIGPLTFTAARMVFAFAATALRRRR